MAIKDMLKRVKKEMHPYHHINMLLIIVIFLLIMLFLIIKPALIGYKVSHQFEESKMQVSDFIKELDVVKANLAIAETKLDSCAKTSEQHLNDLSEEKAKNFECEQKNSQYDYNLSRIQTECEQKKTEIQANLTTLQSEYSALKNTYEYVISNAANNICCKAKVDNKDIDSYIIFSGKITCTIGEKEKISC